MKTARCFSVGAWLLLLWAACPALANPPVVNKVEPPGWWIGHSWNPVRLLIEGRNLAGARLSPAAGLTVGDAMVSTNGDWVFVDVTIAADAKPGRRAMTLSTPAGSTSISFELMRHPVTKGRFQGFSSDDVIYLAMPDRFADGDRANDDPVVSPGMFDRSKPRHYHGGDLAGVMQHLSYLQRLGVTALWLTPWYDNVNHLNRLEKYTADNQRSPQGVPSTDYHGYGAVDFYGVEEHFGNLAALRKLVDKAHGRGLKIIQDQVANHTGPYHRWTTALKREHPRLTILGEMWDGNPKLVSFFQGGRRQFDGVDSGVNTLFDFPLCYAIRDVFARRQPMTRLTETLAADTNYVNAAVLVIFLGLHDMPRFLNENGADLAGLKLAFTFLLTTRGTPLIYYGDEIGMRGGGDPITGGTSRAGSRATRATRSVRRAARPSRLTYSTMSRRCSG